MINNKNTNVVKNISNENVIEEILISPESDSIGIAFTSSVKSNFHVLNIVQLLYSMNDDSYSPVQELATFSFQNYEELKEFIQKLPRLSGIDMLLLLNPLKSNSSLQN